MSYHLNMNGRQTSKVTWINTFPCINYVYVFHKVEIYIHHESILLAEKETFWDGFNLEPGSSQGFFLMLSLRVFFCATSGILIKNQKIYIYIRISLKLFYGNGYKCCWKHSSASFLGNKLCSHSKDVCFLIYLLFIYIHIWYLE